MNIFKFKTTLIEIIYLSALKRNFKLLTAITNLTEATFSISMLNCFLKDSSFSEALIYGRQFQSLRPKVLKLTFS